MGAIEPGHLLILLVALFIVVGPSRLPEVGKAAGEAIKEFRRATTEMRDAVQFDERRPEAPPAAVAAQRAPSSSGAPGSPGGTEATEGQPTT